MRRKYTTTDPVGASILALRGKSHVQRSHPYGKGSKAGAIFAGHQIRYPDICFRANLGRSYNKSSSTRLSCCSNKAYFAEYPEHPCSRRSGIDRVLTCTVHISSMEHKEEMNQSYRQFFSANPPALCTVAVVGIDNNLDVEIEVIAGAD
jgi:hypothetical protein